MTRKLVTLMLVLAMVLTMVPAITAGAESAPVTIDWYFGQGEQTDSEHVNDAVNEYLDEVLPGVHVNMHFWAGQQYWDNMTTMISAGQDVGIIGFGSQTLLDYVVQSQRGGYYPLDELLEEYGAGTKALFPDEVWEAMRINGHIYGIPSLKDNGFYISLIYNATMAEELGIDMESWAFNDFRDVEAVAREVKEKRDEAHPEWADMPVLWDVNLVHPYNFAVENFLNSSFYAVCNLPDIMTIDGYDTETVFNLYATPEYLEFAKQKQSLVEDGIYAYDYTDRSEWQYTGAIFGWSGWGYTYMQDHMYGDAFETKMRLFDNMWTDTNNFFSAGTAISANCATPDKAMQFLNLVNTDSKLATMLRFGIEDEHWGYDEDGKMTFVGYENEVPGSRTYYMWYAAPLGNLTIVNAPETLSGPDSIMLKNMIQYNNDCIKAAHLGFSFDTAPVVNQVAACVNVESQYKNDLVLGRCEADEVEGLVEDLVADLEANGVNDIIAEVQAQIDAWKAAK